MSPSSQQHDVELSDLERRGLELIYESKGLHQSEFWKDLDISSRQGSRVVESLLEYDLIERQEAVYKGHRTYFLRPPARALDFSLLMAGDLLSPFIGSESTEPTSDAFSQWVMNLAFEDYQG